MFKLNKKAMFFSVIALLMISVIIVTVTIQISGETGKSKIQSTQVRIKALNDFIQDLEREYFQNMVDVSANRAIDSLIKYAQNNQGVVHRNNLVRFKQNFETIFFYGYFQKTGSARNDKDTICKDYARWVGKITTEAGGCSYTGFYEKIDEELGEKFMTGYAFFDMLNKTETTFENLGLKIEKFDIELKSFEMIDPWTITGLVTLSYGFSDKDSIASWKGTSSLPFTISIIGLTDPMTGLTIKETDWAVDLGAEFLSWPDGKYHYKNQAGDGCPNIGKQVEYGPCSHEASSFFGRLMNEPNFNPDNKRDVIDGVSFGICPKSLDVHPDPLQHPGCHKK